jgi:hypothetical protein
MRFPQAIATQKRVRVGAESDARRERIESLRIASNYHDVIGLKRVLQPGHDIPSHADATSFFRTASIPLC